MLKIIETNDIVYNRIKYNLNTHFYIENNKTKKLIIELVGIRKVTNLKECLVNKHH